MILLSKLTFRGLENLLDNDAMNIYVPCLLIICNNELHNETLPFTFHFLHPMLQLLLCIFFWECFYSVFYNRR